MSAVDPTLPSDDGYVQHEKPPRRSHTCWYVAALVDIEVDSSGLFFSQAPSLIILSHSFLVGSLLIDSVDAAATQGLLAWP